MTALQPLKQIESRRLLLRPISLKDADELYQLRKEPLSANMVFMTDRASFLDCLQREVFSWLHGLDFRFRFVFIYKKSGALIGSGCLTSNINKHSYELSLWVSPRFHGKRFEQEAVNLLARYAFDAFLAESVYVIIQKRKQNALGRFLNYYFQKSVQSNQSYDALKKIYYYSLHSVKQLPLIYYHFESDIALSKEARAIEWALDCLCLQNIFIDISRSRVVAQTPWSLVVLLKSAAQDTYYLKIAAKGLGDEAKILKYLRTQYTQHVPLVILENEETGAFVTKELGCNLRSLLKIGTGVHFLEKAVLGFAALQKETASDIIALQQIGVPDWSLDKIPTLTAELFQEKELLITEGLTQEEYAKLGEVQNRIEQACQNLLSDHVPMTLVQCDFHDNNIVVDTKSNTVGFIDLGEVVISHPFYSIMTFMKQLRKHHDTFISENQLDALYKKYSACWNIKTSTFFQQSIELTWLIFEALGQYRLFQSCCVKKLRARQKGKLGASLRELINK